MIPESKTRKPCEVRSSSSNSKASPNYPGSLLFAALTVSSLLLITPLHNASVSAYADGAPDIGLFLAIVCRLLGLSSCAGLFATVYLFCNPKKAAEE